MTAIIDFYTILYNMISDLINGFDAILPVNLLDIPLTVNDFSFTLEDLVINCLMFVFVWISFMLVINFIKYIMRLIKSIGRTE